MPMLLKISWLSLFCALVCGWVNTETQKFCMQYHNYSIILEIQNRKRGNVEQQIVFHSVIVVCYHSYTLLLN